MATTTINLGRVKGAMWYTGTADDNVSISAELASAGYIPIKLDVYLNTENGNVYQYLSNGDTLSWQLRGNLRGAAGPDLAVQRPAAGRLRHPRRPLRLGRQRQGPL